VGERNDTEGGRFGGIEPLDPRVLALWVVIALNRPIGRHYGGAQWPKGTLRWGLRLRLFVMCLAKTDGALFFGKLSIQKTAACVVIRMECEADLESRGSAGFPFRKAEHHATFGSHQ
jgi:hypothetical protein